MATDEAFIKDVAAMCLGQFDITYKKMFGEYLIYADSKPALLVCDNTVFVKKNYGELKAFNGAAKTGFPYNGAKEHYVVDFYTDKKKMDELLNELVPLVPIPKKKNKK